MPLLKPCPSARAGGEPGNWKIQPTREWCGQAGVSPTTRSRRRRRIFWLIRGTGGPLMDAASRGPSKAGAFGLSDTPCAGVARASARAADGSACFSFFSRKEATSGADAAGRQYSASGTAHQRAKRGEQIVGKVKPFGGLAARVRDRSPKGRDGRGVQRPDWLGWRPHAGRNESPMATAKLATDAHRLCMDNEGHQRDSQLVPFSKHVPGVSR